VTGGEPKHDLDAARLWDMLTYAKEIHRTASGMTLEQYLADDDRRLETRPGTAGRETSAASEAAEGLWEACLLLEGGFPAGLLTTERRLEIIGEAARTVSQPFRDAHPEIPWRQIIGLPNVLAHEYGEIRQKRLLAVVTDRIPSLVQALEPLIPPLPDGSED
jgi:uncharacterized protein with HEPN domain